MKILTKPAGPLSMDKTCKPEEFRECRYIHNGFCLCPKISNGKTPCNEYEGLRLYEIKRRNEGNPLYKDVCQERQHERFNF